MKSGNGSKAIKIAIINSPVYGIIYKQRHVCQRYMFSRSNQGKNIDKIVIDINAITYNLDDLINTVQKRISVLCILKAYTILSCPTTSPPAKLHPSTERSALVVILIACCQLKNTNTIMPERKGNQGIKVGC